MGMEIDTQVLVEFVMLDVHVNEPLELILVFHIVMHQDYGTAFWEEFGSPSCSCGSARYRGRRVAGNSATVKRAWRKDGRKIFRRKGA